MAAARSSSFSSAAFRRRARLGWPDAVILALGALAILTLSTAGTEWGVAFRPAVQIDLSVAALPKYALLSATRGLLAYLVSFVFAVATGYAAARFPRLEKVIIPALDIGQSVPIMGFLPGTVLALTALFPDSNIGLELAVVLLIFTSQTWNMAFSVYASIKGVPKDLIEISEVMGLGRWARFTKLELPFSAVNLAWNSVISMAGGWFFLTTAEAFTLGPQEFRLPGIGSYMAVAIAQGDREAMVAGIIAMILLIFVIDTVLWRPVLAWVRRFRGEGAAPGAGEGSVPEPIVQHALRESRLVRRLKVLGSRSLARRLQRVQARGTASGVDQPEGGAGRLALGASAGSWRGGRSRWSIWAPLRSPRAVAWGSRLAWVAGAVLVIGAFGRLAELLAQNSGADWLRLLSAAAFTFGRVLAAVVLSTLWTVPVGVWIALSPRRLAWAQPWLQLLASFPAPMVFPLVLTVLFALGVPFGWATIFLMMLGAQWYVLFNVLAGALKAPRELGEVLAVIGSKRRTFWRALYLPTVFPSLVNGWIIAAGGAWNASVVSEIMIYSGERLQTRGLGATITLASEAKDFPLLAGGLTVMVTMVILLNRTVWAWVYDFAHSRYRLEA